MRTKYDRRILKWKDNNPKGLLSDLGSLSHQGK